MDNPFVTGWENGRFVEGQGQPEGKDHKGKTAK